MNKTYHLAKLYFNSPLELSKSEVGVETSVKVPFNSSLHLSKGKSGLDTSFEVLHSDTLKSALFACALELFGEEAILRGGNGKAFFESFRISSAFPFAGDELFFQKPEWLPNTFTENTDLRKDIKKIRFFDKESFEALLNGKLNDFTKEDIQHSKYYSKHKIEKPFVSESVQRVVVSRTSEQDPDTFLTERLFFAENCGLFCLMQFENENFKQEIIAALRLLGDNGVGADKSVGNGQFIFKDLEPFEFQFTEKAGYQVSLSLFCPKSGEVQKQDFLEKSAYSLTKRGGYVASHANFEQATLRKRSVFMFTEGAVFPNDATLKGDVKDLKPSAAPEHAIWRDGRAIFFPYHLTEK